MSLILPPSQRAVIPAPSAGLRRVLTLNQRRRSLIEKSQVPRFNVFIKRAQVLFSVRARASVTRINREPPSSWIRAHLSLSTTDSTSIRWARDSLLSPASSVLSHPPNLLCFQAIILLTHCPRYSRTDCRQDEAFPKVRGLHISKSPRWLLLSPLRISMWGNSQCAFSSRHGQRERSRLPKICFVCDSALRVSFDWSHSSGCR